ncbi:unnamed protein product [Allacma fusca]|uniref:Uncharacterized protein n=1 Tax=Allacma fusca TaxID=39272 RepID=A0A8J2K4N7_9HEXA|nr:unnamed protein product [Allacma fusca]
MSTIRTPPKGISQPKITCYTTKRKIDKYNETEEESTPNKKFQPTTQAIQKEDLRSQKEVEININGSEQRQDNMGLSEGGLSNMNAETREEIKGIKADLLTLETNINLKWGERMQEMETKCEQMGKEMKMQEEAIQKLASENEYLKLQLRKKNLLIGGIDQGADETEESLKRIIIGKLQFFGVQIDEHCVDTVYRIGKPSMGRRLVMLKLNSESKAMKILSKEKAIRVRGITIREDLTETERKNRYELRKKFRDLKSAGSTPKWTKRGFICANLMYTAINGEIKEETIRTGNIGYASNVKGEKMQE